MNFLDLAHGAYVLLYYISRGNFLDLAHGAYVVLVNDHYLETFLTKPMGHLIIGVKQES